MAAQRDLSRVKVKGDPTIFEGAPFLGIYRRLSQDAWLHLESKQYYLYWFDPKSQWIIGKERASGEGWIYAKVKSRDVSPVDVPIGSWSFFDPDERNWKTGGGLAVARTMRSIESSSSKNKKRPTQSSTSGKSQQEGKGEGYEWGRSKKRTKTTPLEAAEGIAQRKGEKLRDAMRRMRQEGLETSIPKSNIGHRLLAKMGYKSGMGLGKNGHGRTAPVGMQVKVTRTGLGRDAEVREVRNIRKRLSKKVDEAMKGTFINTARARAKLRRLEKDLAALRRICQDLDRKHGIEANELWGNGVEEGVGGYESDDDKQAIPTLQDFERPDLKSDLRVSNSNSNSNLNSDLNPYANPLLRGGPEREEIDINDNAARYLLSKESTHDHIYEKTSVRATIKGQYVAPGRRGKKLVLVLEGRSRADLTRARNLIDNLATATGGPSRSLEDTQKLVIELLTYLRASYFYCYYCSITFESDADMNRNCPGPTMEDHD
ncbi:hypothetical protein AAMO2058_001505600 [Amorphochlora amoebiformis]